MILFDEYYRLGRSCNFGVGPAPRDPTPNGAEDGQKFCKKNYPT